MAAPILVACLVTLRTEFNTLAPKRDKGADGWIGDAAHQRESSDHNPDESGATPYEDADNINEVHALDIDKDLGGGLDLDDYVQRIVADQKAGRDVRLQNVIWRGRIASRSWGWTWRTYTGPSKHFDHAHFSARYTTAQEKDTSPWGVLGEDWFTMATKADLKAALKELILSDADVRAQLQALPWQYKGGGLHGAGTSLEALGDSQDLVVALGKVSISLEAIKVALNNPTGNPTHPIAK